MKLQRGIIILALGGSLALGGCAELGNIVGAVTGSAVSPQAVYLAANSFDVIEATATNYDKLPPCSSGTSYLCRTPSGVATVDIAIRSGISLRNQLEAYVTTNPGSLVPISNYNALLAVISTINSVVQAAGVKS